MNEGARPALPPRVGKVGLKSNPSPPERSSHQERMGASGFKTRTIRLSSSDFRLIDLARLQSSKERASVSSMASLVSQVLAPHDRCSLVPRLTDFVAQRAPLRQYARLAQRRLNISRVNEHPRGTASAPPAS